MKHYRIYLAVGALVLATLACQTLTGRGTRDTNDMPPSNDNGGQPGSVQPTQVSNDNSNSSVDSEFPMTADAFNVVDVGDGSIVYYTRLSAEDAMEFYRDTYTAMGYREREILTIVAEGTFSMVFDGDPSGKAVVIQSVDLGDGTRTIAIRLEDV